MRLKLPLASDRDRLAAARYAAYRLYRYLSRRQKRARSRWLVCWNSDGRVMSEHEPRI